MDTISFGNLASLISKTKWACCLTDMIGAFFFITEDVNSLITSEPGQ